MNQVAPFEGKPLAKNALQDRLSRFKQTRPKSSDGSIFLKMAKDGEWSFGAEEEIPEEDSRWACNPNSVQQGYICWPRNEEDRGGGPLDEQMYDAGDDIPFLADMPHREGGEWTDQLSIGMKCMNGEDKDVEVVYKTNSKSGVRELNALIDDIIGQVEADGAPIPVIALKNDWYKHKKYGKIYTPVLEIVDWLDVSGQSTGDDDAEPEKEAKPSTRSRRAKDKAEPEEEPKSRSRHKAKPDADTTADADADAGDDEGDAPAPEPDEAPAPRRRRRRS